MPLIILFLFVFCLADAFLTHIGLVNGYISEGNPLMHYVYMQMGVSWFFILKLGLPLILFLVRKRLKSRWIHIALSFALSLYFSVISLHVYWVVKIV